MSTLGSVFIKKPQALKMLQGTGVLAVAIHGVGWQGSRAHLVHCSNRFCNEMKLRRKATLLMPHTRDRPEA